MRFLSTIWIVASFLAAGCSSTGGLPQHFAQHAFGVIDTGRARIDVFGGAIHGAAVPVEEGALPKAVKRTIASVQPDGDVRSRTRDDSGEVPFYRIVTAYGGDVRELVVDYHGIVISRSHTIAVAEAPPSARRAAEATGQIDSVRFVHDNRHGDHYAFDVSRDGARYLVACQDDGSALHVARILDAELLVWR